MNILVLLTTFIAAWVGTVTGFGTSTITVPVLTLFFPLHEVLLFVGIIHWFGDIWKMLFFRSGIQWKILLYFGIVGIGFSYIGARLSFSVDESVLLRLLGVFLLAYVLFILMEQKFTIVPSNVYAVIGGISSGLSAGIFGVGGAIRGAFLSVYNLPKDVYIFTSGAIAFSIDTTRIATYYSEGTGLEQLNTMTLFAAIPLSLIAAYLAKKTVDSIPQKYFRIVIVLFLGIIAVRYMAYG